MWNIDEEAGDIIFLHLCVVFHISTVPSPIHTHKSKGQPVSHTRYWRSIHSDTWMWNITSFIRFPLPKLNNFKHFGLGSLLDFFYKYMISNCKRCPHLTHNWIVSRAPLLVRIHQKLHAVLSSESSKLLCMHFNGCMAYVAFIFA